jgi:hypothetical protein
MMREDMAIQGLEEEDLDEEEEEEDDEDDEDLGWVELFLDPVMISCSLFLITGMTMRTTTM